ncbi:hypothetical protein WME79_45420 [Sorangium sp. So ce726]|uniref:hypothetical protein n=1 Tax=Sorangium sp. So ce726 TaxID=3133319 RepID=UPI003F622116
MGLLHTGLGTVLVDDDVAAPLRILGDSLEVQGNESLPSCKVKAFVERLAWPPYNVFQENNGAGTCSPSVRTRQLTRDSHAGVTIRSAERFSVRGCEGHAPFPLGAWVFPAELAVVQELHAVLQATFREWRVVTPAEIEGQVPRAFAFDGLLGFLARRPAFDRALAGMRSPIEASRIATLAAVLRLSRDEVTAALCARATGAGLVEGSTVVYNSLSRAAQRVEGLQELAASDAIIDFELALARLVAQPSWTPQIDWSELVPDAVEAASCVDPASGAAEVDVDIARLVLLAAQCCVGPTAHALSDDLDGLEWMSLATFDGDAPAPEPAPGSILVRPSVVAEQVERLAFAAVPAALRAITPGGALLAVTLVEDEA